MKFELILTKSEVFRFDAENPDHAMKIGSEAAKQLGFDYYDYSIVKDSESPLLTYNEDTKEITINLTT
jgi:hypothetical protein